MHERPLQGVEGIRCVPDVHRGVGALVLAGSSGRVDVARSRVLAASGVLAESVRWFGGEGQHDGPWEIALELFLDRISLLRNDCERVLVLGTSFGAEAALLAGSLSDDVDAVVGFAPSDIVWAGVTRQGRVTSHWTHRGALLPHVPFDEDWVPDDDPPAYVGLYRRSRRTFARATAAAAIAVERIPEVVLVAGGDDQVWPSVDHAERIVARRSAHGLTTTVLTEPDAGHRAILPGEPVVSGGQRMRRGGTEQADRRLGQRAWQALQLIT